MSCEVWVLFARILLAASGLAILEDGAGHHELELIAVVAFIAAHVDSIVIANDLEIAGARLRTSRAVGVV